MTIEENHTVDYTYTSDGLRTRKYEYNGNEYYYYDHSYVLDGSKILKETILYSSAFNGNSTTTLEYYYDESGISSFRYNGTYYYYLKNLQDDVIGIIDNTGAVVVEYAYDAWGNILSITGELASTVGQYNPFRYRGYYYDSETGLYYLNSRYYDAEVGRFISADSVMASVSSTLDGYNLFAYCFNNPVNMVDDNGYWADWFEEGVKLASGILLVVGVVATVAAVSAFTMGTGSAAAVFGATVILGAALGGINGGMANEAKGQSYANGYFGGLVGGTTQALASRFPGGSSWGGAIGSAAGTTLTMLLDNADPYSSDYSIGQIATSAATSGGKALLTGAVTEYVNVSVGGIDYNTGELTGGIADGYGGLMPDFTLGAGETYKAFWGWLDDLLVYLWE